MSENLDDFENIYFPELKTKDDVMKFIEKGMFFKQNRIEELFYIRFVGLRKKIHKLLTNEILDDFDYNIYVNSILVDCRALFLENPRYRFNGTLQSTYRARNLGEYAEGIDEFFDREVVEGKSLKVVIKDWVDKKLVHIAYLEPEDEILFYENILSIINRETLGNIFHDILIIARQYEEIRELYGENVEEQVDRTLSWLTG
ncbi:hypothetical protein BZG72_07290 [Salinivibrio sp. PR6]|uniref:hypothetical protein n=1 Tax=Salinivibrio sp. PR6 TaxID=1909485 RepID=UPI000989067A|nr:hypothetical protein [Salinivibrio sp. PR6]OOE82800.1 hypothetical protein BZG72_07290 [Salinivibrio sp. PR6]